MYNPIQLHVTAANIHLPLRSALIVNGKALGPLGYSDFPVPPSNPTNTKI